MIMTTISTQFHKLAAWQAIEAHYSKVRELHLRKLFAEDPKRGERMTVEAIGIYFDYSKHRITDEIPVSKPGATPESKDELKSLPVPELQVKLGSSPDGLSQAATWPGSTSLGLDCISR